MKTVTVFNLFFHNDGGERDFYGTFATRQAAEAVIAETQEEYGEDVFETEAFEIVCTVCRG